MSGPPRWRRALAKGALSLAALSTALLAAEGLYRWSQAGPEDQPRDDGQWRARYRRMNETIYQRSEDKTLVYEPRPGSQVEMEYGLAGFNSAGMRDDREHPRRPPPDKTRVALLGDSLVWSEFLSLEDSLGRRLQGELGASYEVLPFGVSGYDTAQEARWYEEAIRPFSPQALVLVYCMNDMMIMSGPYNRYADDEERRRKEEQDRMFDRVAPVRRETLDQVARREEEGATLRLLARALAISRRATFASRYIDEYTVVAEDPERSGATLAALSRLGGALERDGVRAILVISPVLESWERYHWSSIHARVGEAGRAAGFEVVDPIEGWRGELAPEGLRFPGDNLHYNLRGTKALASVIAEAVRGGTQR